MLRTALLALLILASPALAQEVERQPLDPALDGVWELVEMTIPDADLEVGHFRLTFDGDSVSVDRTVRVGGETREQAYTVQCYDASGVIACLPSPDGSTGYSGLGRYELDGDVLRLSMPETNYYAVFRRVEAE